MWWTLKITFTQQTKQFILYTTNYDQYYLASRVQVPMGTVVTGNEIAVMVSHPLVHPVTFMCTHIYIHIHIYLDNRWWMIRFHRHEGRPRVDRIYTLREYSSWWLSVNTILLLNSHGLRFIYIRPMQHYLSQHLVAYYLYNCIGYEGNDRHMI